MWKANSKKREATNKEAKGDNIKAERERYKAQPRPHWDFVSFHNTEPRVLIWIIINVKVYCKNGGNVSGTFAATWNNLQTFAKRSRSDVKIIRNVGNHSELYVIKMVSRPDNFISILTKSVTLKRNIVWYKLTVYSVEY